MKTTTTNCIKKCNINKNNYYGRKRDITSLHNVHTSSPLMETITGPQFTKINFLNIILMFVRNRTVILLQRVVKQRVLKCINITHHNQNTVVLGYGFLDISEVYIKPINSLKIGYLSSNKSII